MSKVTPNKIHQQFHASTGTQALCRPLKPDQATMYLSLNLHLCISYTNKLQELRGVILLNTCRVCLK